MLFVGESDGMERALVEREDVPFATIHAGALNGVGVFGMVRGVLRLLRGLREALGHIAAFRPDVVLLTGGFVGVPMALAARLRRVPAVVYLPDIEPGLALNLMARFAQRIAVTTEESARFVAEEKMVVTGYPVREAFAGANRDDARARLGLPAEGPVLLVFGGSRGAQSINRAVVAGIEELTAVCNVVQVTGATSWPEVADAHVQASASVRARWRVHQYLHEEMVDAMAAADLTVCRSGASALGELPCVGLPAILVPYPYAWRFQKVNAQYLVDRGAAMLLEDGALAGELVTRVVGLLQNSAELSAMRAASLKLAQRDGAERIARVMLEVVGD